jgi:hypothetical protein
MRLKPFLIVWLLLPYISFSQTSFQNVVNTTYNSDGYVSTESSTASNGDIVTKTYRYPKDVIHATCVAGTSSNEVVNGVKKLLSLNVYDKPIEVYTTINHSGTSEVVEAILYNYCGDRPYPRLLKTIRNKVLLSNFTPFSISSSCSVTSYVGYTDEERYDSYDNTGNVTQITLITKANEPVSYLYGYNGAYKIAQVQNSQFNETAYSGFETSETGNWTYNQIGVINNPAGTQIGTGNKIYDFSLGGTITFTGTVTQRYVVSYRRKGPSPTVSGTSSTKTIATQDPSIFYEEKILNNSSSLTISGSGSQIDDLRVYPYDARMKNATYAPLIGITSQTDERADLTFYEYDKLGRISLIRNHNRDIVKKYNYELNTEDAQ